MMSKFSELLKSLKESLFGEAKHDKPSASPISSEPLSTTPTLSIISTTSSRTKRDPFIVQIGFDFGTAYSKCICRDIVTNKAWIHIPTDVDDAEWPFLIRGVLQIENGKLTRLKSTDAPGNCVLYNLKQALEKVALKQWEDPILESYRSMLGLTIEEHIRLTNIVEACAVYFLAGALGDVRSKVRERLNAQSELPNDYFAVNMAVPVADAQIPQVNKTYQRVLCKAWQLADTIPNYPSMKLNDLEGLLCCYDSHATDACFIYPEASANVQGFVRSRASSPGIYLFTDTGAGTVDQGVFIFVRDNNGEFLTYLHGSVLPLGSSYIERYAADALGDLSFQILEKWREEKERGSISPELVAAREQISKQLNIGSTATIAQARSKLHVRQQMCDVRLIFGGGGHCVNPYEMTVKLPFSGNLFGNAFTPDVVGIPRPNDLEIGIGQDRWLPRLSVAYGLSFLKNELSPFIYPVDVQPPAPQMLWRPQVHIPDAPTLDEV